MKLTTILKAGSLALDIFNHQSTQQLSGLVRGGIKRRTTQLPGPAHSPQSPMTSTQHRSVTQQFQNHRGSPPPSSSGQWPQVPLRDMMKYVTPENMKKVQEWHGIIRSFLDKD